MICGSIHCDNKKILPMAQKTENWLERMRGLLCTTQKVRCQGLWITPCNSIHTMFMASAIDVYFLDKENKIIKCVNNLVPQRLAGCRQACAVLEVETGVLNPSLLAPGKILQWV